MALGGSLGAGGVSGTGAADNAVFLNTTAGLVIAWLDHAAGVTNVYARRFDGANWVALAAGSDSGLGVSNAVGDVFDLAAATDGTKVALAWTQTVAGTRQLYLREFSGGAFNELSGSAGGSGVSAAPGDKQAPTLAYAGGILFAAWQNATGAAQEIYAARYTGAAWVSAGATGGGVSNTNGRATQPKLAASGGTLYLAWTDDRTTARTGNTVEVYAKRWNGTAFVEEIRGDASYRGVSQNAIAATTPALAVDPSDHPFVAWDDIASGSPEVRVRGNFFTVGTIYYVKDGAINGDSFTTAVGAVGNDGRSSPTPKLSVQVVLDAYVLNPGDVILVDGGTYADPITFGSGDSGFLLLGSPNHPNILQGRSLSTGPRASRSRT